MTICYPLMTNPIISPSIIIKSKRVEKNEREREREETGFRK